jgi:hypothetical protein
MVGIDRADDLQRMFFLERRRLRIGGSWCPFVDAWVIASAIARSVPSMGKPAISKQHLFQQCFILKLSVKERAVKACVALASE